MTQVVDLPPGTAIADLPTPCLIVDEARLEANLLRAQAYADAQGVALRPHAKTHKSPTLARRQLKGGAVGVCVAKLGEAEAFADAGIDDIVMAHTTVGAPNALRAARLARRIRFAVGVDHPRQVDDLARAATAEGAELHVRIEIDVGSGRGGIAPAAAPDLLERILAAGGLVPDGVYAYEGFTYAAHDRDDLVARHQTAQDLLVSVAERLAPRLPGPAVVSLGSTPSLSAEIPLRSGVTEIRPGTAIFFDAQQAGLAGGIEHCAADVLATVVSRGPDRAILDAGSKSLTSDGIRDGVLAVRGHGRLRGRDAVVARVSEEHGVVEGDDAAGLEVGDRVRIVPNHICPVVNLFDTLVLTDGDRIREVLPVATRGRVD